MVGPARPTVAIANVLNASKDDFVLLQETKIHKESVRKVAGHTARRLGWSHCLGTAHRTSASMGSGGCGVLARKGTGISDKFNSLIRENVAHRICIACQHGWPPLPREDST